MRTKVATKPKVMRLLSLFLVFVMLITTQGFTTIAGTVSENEEAGENEEQEYVELKSISQNSVQAGTETPGKPIHHHNEDDSTQDTTTWSYVYFGSYPQSEVTDTDTINAIEAAIAKNASENEAYTGEKQTPVRMYG